MKFKRNSLDKNGNTIWDYAGLVVLAFSFIKIIDALALLERTAFLGSGQGAN